MSPWIRTIALALCIVVAGCADGPFKPRFEGKQQQKDCDDTGPCIVSVAVGCGDTCITVDYDVVVVRRKSRIDIKWELSNAGDFRFPADGGVVIDAPEGEFRCHVEANGRRYVCMDNHGNKEVAVYKYSIKLTGPKTLTYDPWVIND